MPVSKKRKKDGKPVQRAQVPAEQHESAHGPDTAHAAAPPKAGGKPSNPFVAQAAMKRGAQRGR